MEHAVKTAVAARTASLTGTSKMAPMPSALSVSGPRHHVTPLSTPFVALTTSQPSTIASHESVATRYDVPSRIDEEKCVAQLSSHPAACGLSAPSFSSAAIALKMVSTTVNVVNTIA